MTYFSFSLQRKRWETVYGRESRFKREIFTLWNLYLRGKDWMRERERERERERLVEKEREEDWLREREREREREKKTGWEIRTEKWLVKPILFEISKFNFTPAESLTPYSVFYLCMIQKCMDFVCFLEVSNGYWELGIKLYLGGVEASVIQGYSSLWAL